MSNPQTVTATVKVARELARDLFIEAANEKGISSINQEQMRVLAGHCCLMGAIFAEGSANYFTKFRHTLSEKPAIPAPKSTTADNDDNE